MKRCLPWIVVLGAYLFAGARLFLLISRYSVNILAWDQWDFDDATLFQHHSLWEMFCWQNGPHRQGLGALFQRLVDPFMLWNSQREAFAVGAVILVAAALALLLKIRLYGSIGYCDVIIPLLFLTSLQYETLVAATNPAHGPLPLLLVVLYCLCWQIRNYHWKYTCILLTNFCLIYTGFGVFVGFLTPALLVAHYYRHLQRPAPERRWSAAALAISLASLASFFVRYRLQPAVECFSPLPRSPADYLRFVALMFAHVASLRIPSPTLAAIVGLIVLLWILAGVLMAAKGISQSESASRDAAIEALLTYSAIFCLSTAYGRLCLGVQSASSSRYTEYVVLGYLGLYLFALSISKRSLRAAAVVVLLVLSLLSARRLNRIDAGGLEAISNGKRAWRECYLARHNIEQCNSLTNFQVYFNAQRPGLQEKLDFLERNHLNLFDGSP